MHRIDSKGYFVESTKTSLVEDRWDTSQAQFIAVGACLCGNTCIFLYLVDWLFAGLGPEVFTARFPR